MSCRSYDWKAYAFGELAADARRAAETHAATCADCRDELAGMRLTLDALSTLREEEVPRRIAFVSDKVFEPKWWQKVWSPNFAAACVVAGAIVFHGFAGSQKQTEIDTAVYKAVAQIEAKHAAESQEMLAAFDFVQKQYNTMIIKSAGMTRE